MSAVVVYNVRFVKRSVDSFERSPPRTQSALDFCHVRTLQFPSALRSSSQGEFTAEGFRLQLFGGIFQGGNNGEGEPVVRTNGLTFEKQLTLLCRLCPKCNKSRMASKKVSLTRPPAVLILHLKRYTVLHDSWGEKMIRNNALVDFPLDDLDLTRYVSPVTQPDGRTQYPQAIPPCKYRLYGVTNHVGSESLDRGHCQSLCQVFLFCFFTKYFRYRSYLV